MVAYWVPPDPPDDLPRVLAHEDGEYRWLLINRLGRASSQMAVTVVTEPCPACNGDGETGDGSHYPRLCKQCGGTGKIAARVETHYG